MLAPTKRRSRKLVTARGARVGNSIPPLIMKDVAVHICATICGGVVSADIMAKVEILMNSNGKRRCACSSYYGLESRLPHCGFIVIAGIQASAAEGRSGSVPRDDFRLYYRIVGASGPYVILTAGGPGIDVDYLASAAEALKGSYRVVLLEQRGTGRSVLPVLDESKLDLRSYMGDLAAL